MRLVASRFAVVSAGLIVLLARPSGAQDPAAPAAPCLTTACGLVFDWGTGKTAGTYGQDQRYGSGDDFESGVRRAFLTHGITLRTTDDGPFTITIRPKVDSRAMCDRMAGTGTRFSCVVVSDVAVNFALADAAVKPPGALRLTNRCGGESARLSMGQFGQYVGDMIWWTIIPAEAKEKKPALRC